METACFVLAILIALTIVTCAVRELFLRAKVVRMGTGAAHIVSVTKRRIDYVDEGGREVFVDLDECARVWARRHGAPGPTVGGKYMRFVGWRGPTWIQFYDRRRTQFEFQTCDAMVGDVLMELRRVECLANDAT
jgi:hypothetical protein